MPQPEGNIPAAGTPKVSVIVPAYNAASFIAATLESLAAQTFADFEVLVGDDGSRDATTDIVKAFVARDSRFQLHSLAHKGAFGARNAMLALARGNYVMFHDADDLSAPNRMFSQVSLLDRHPEFIGVSCVMEKFWGNPPTMPGPVAAAVLAPYTEEKYDLRPFRYTKRNFAFPACMVRREALQRVGGFRPCFDFAEDADFTFRLAEHGRLATLTDVLFFYRQHAGNTSRRAPYRQTESSVLSRVVARYRRKGWPDRLYGKQPTFFRIFTSGLPPLGVVESLWLLLTRYAYRRIKISRLSG